MRDSSSSPSLEGHKPNHVIDPKSIYWAMIGSAALFLVITVRLVHDWFLLVVIPILFVSWLIFTHLKINLRCLKKSDQAASYIWSQCIGSTEEYLTMDRIRNIVSSVRVNDGKLESNLLHFYRDLLRQASFSGFDSNARLLERYERVNEDLGFDADSFRNYGLLVLVLAIIVIVWPLIPGYILILIDDKLNSDLLEQSQQLSILFLSKVEDLGIILQYSLWYFISLFVLIYLYTKQKESHIKRMDELLSLLIEKIKLGQTPVVTINSAAEAIMKLNEIIVESDGLKNWNSEIVRRHEKTLWEKWASFPEKKILDVARRSEIYKYSAALEKIRYILFHQRKYDDNKWQSLVLELVLIIYPQYIYAEKGVQIPNFDNSGHVKPDFVLVDFEGNLDILLIRKGLDLKIVGRYVRDSKNNNILHSKMLGAVTQTERHIYHLNRWGRAGEQELLKRFQKNIPTGIKDLKIINPRGMLLMGFSENLSEHERRDFEIARRQYRNIVDIITYDDLQTRLENALAYHKQLQNLTVTEVSSVLFD